MDAQTLLSQEAIGFAAQGRRSIKQQIADKIAALIGSGVLAVGDPLPAERDLAHAMGVSRETVRGAILILSTHGVLQVVQGARTLVASDDVGELALAPLPRHTGGYGLEDVHEARLLVEGRLAALAAERVDAATLDRLDALVADQVAGAGDPVRFLMLDREFHTLVYRAGCNAALADIATTLYAHLLDQRRRVVARPGAVARAIADPRDILAALRARDSAAAAAAFAVHEQRIYDTTRRMLDGSDKTTKGGKI
ncbi:MAG: FadR/GntR family transcriptional regulator [Shimia sp.]